MEHNKSMEDLLECFAIANFSSEDEGLKDCIIKVAIIYNKCKRHQYHMIARYMSERFQDPDMMSICFTIYKWLIYFCDHIKKKLMNY